MTLKVLRAGLQSTLQGQSRTGQRHLGVPTCGPADPLSMGIANHLVGNDVSVTAIETTLNGIDIKFLECTTFAVAGADCEIRLSDQAIDRYMSHHVKAGDTLSIGAALSGARTYLAIAGGLQADSFLGSDSTYLPAGFGGCGGRALRDQDVLAAKELITADQVMVAPDAFRPDFSASVVLRTSDGPDFDLLSASDQDRLYVDVFTVGQRADRMGVELIGAVLETCSDGRLSSAAIFPGSIQCPPGGVPYLLSVDAQTTGGYPWIAQVARADRHLIGQLRPQSRLHFARRTPEQAQADLRQKRQYWGSWLPGAEQLF